MVERGTEIFSERASRRDSVRKWEKPATMLATSAAPNPAAAILNGKVAGGVERNERTSVPDCSGGVRRGARGEHRGRLLPFPDGLSPAGPLPKDPRSSRDPR